MQKGLIYLILVVIVISLAGIFWRVKQDTGNGEYNPIIDPNNFVDYVNNKYFTLIPGTGYRYVKQTDEGVERIEVLVTDEKKQVLGINAIVVRDKVFLNEELTEDTKDWYAQDKQGNVWYFGEEVDNYKDGKLIDHSGSWEAGVNGAKPGIIMKANPIIGEVYRQEYYKNEAEDMGEIVALEKRVVVPYGSFEHCLQTRDWSQIDKASNEYKFYCSELSALVLEQPVNGDEGRTELIEIFTTFK